MLLYVTILMAAAALASGGASDSCSDYAERAVKAYPKAQRQAAAASVGGKPAWKALSWPQRLDALESLRRPDAAHVNKTGGGGPGASKTCGDTPRCFLCVDVDGARAKFARAQAFVAAKDLAYNLSSNVLAELGGGERARLPELFANDWEWGQKGSILLDLPPERIVVELDRGRAPLAVENFVALVTGEKGKSSKSGKQLHYRNTPFHRVLPGFVAQAGDISTGTGAGGESIYGKKFKDDLKGLKTKLGARGQLAMCNTGKNSNTSQFFFSLGPATKKLTGKHVVFGRIVEGMEVLDLIEAAGGTSADDGKPRVLVQIVDCGLC